MADDEPREPEESAGGEPPAESAAPPETKKKKLRTRKAKKAPAGAKVPVEKPLPGAGTPDGEKLREAVRAFEIGDHARVRARAADLASSEDPEVRDFAKDLARRVAIDPLQIAVVLLCAVVLVTIAFVWVL